MDISKEYIKMCEKAQEIQEYRKQLPEKYKGESDKDYLAHLKGAIISFNAIWLPRQDQLSEMIVTWNKNISTAFFMNIVSNSKYRSIPIEGFDSIEKHLLSFVMAENYNKIWNKESEEWQVV